MNSALLVAITGLYVGVVVVSSLVHWRSKKHAASISLLQKEIASLREWHLDEKNKRDKANSDWLTEFAAMGKRMEAVEGGTMPDSPTGEANREPTAPSAGRDQ